MNQNVTIRNETREMKMLCIKVTKLFVNYDKNLTLFFTVVFTLFYELIGHHCNKHTLEIINVNARKRCYL